MNRVDGKLPERRELGEIFSSWVATYAPGNGPVRPIIVAVAGGASRAAVWGAQVLEEIERSTVPCGPAVLAVSSVSGSFLRVAGYKSLLASLPEDERTVEDKRPVRLRQVALLGTAPLGHDVLAPLLSGWLAVNFPRTLLSPVAAAARIASGGSQPRGGDRADAIERAFETLWQGPWMTTPRSTFDLSFLSLFYEKKSDAYVSRKGMPLWSGNGTDVGTGSRLLTVPFMPKPPPSARSPNGRAPDPKVPFDQKRWPCGAARDVLSLMNADVPISTAINNTSRFPYLEPSGELLRADPAAGNASRSWSDRICDQVLFCKLGPTDIVDGGYFENEGLQTTLNLAAWLKEMNRKCLDRTVPPIIVQVTASGDPDITPKGVIRWNSLPRRSDRAGASTGRLAASGADFRPV